MLIMARVRHLPLLAALESCGIDVLPVCGCTEGRQMLEIQPQVQVVLTDAVFASWGLAGVLQIVAQAGANIEVVVCSRLGTTSCGSMFWGRVAMTFWLSRTGIMKRFGELSRCCTRRWLPPER